MSPDIVEGNTVVINYCLFGALQYVLKVAKFEKVGRQFNVKFVAFKCISTYLILCQAGNALARVIIFCTH